MLLVKLQVWCKPLTNKQVDRQINKKKLLIITQSALGVCSEKIFIRRVSFPSSHTGADDGDDDDGDDDDGDDDDGDDDNGDDDGDDSSSIFV
jgi:hypothetical protein